MNKDIKDRWVKALRSGIYKQGRYKLRSFDDTYCCLGVLCDLYLDDEEAKWTAENNIYSIGQSVSEPPSYVVQWAGLDSANPVVDTDQGKRSLIGLNDTYEMSFTEIADLIEAQL